jgi:hypothetical protein
VQPNARVELGRRAYRLIKAAAVSREAPHKAHVDHHRSGRCRTKFRVVPDATWRAEIGSCPRLLRPLDTDGTVLLCLHQWGIHEHPPLTRLDPSSGNGLLLFFRVDDFDEALPRARALVSRLEEEPHRNPNTGTMELHRRPCDGWRLRLARSHGLTCDILDQLTVIDSQASTLQASTTSEPDLFWACRGGGGGSFGIATQFVLRIFPLTDVLVYGVSWKLRRSHAAGIFSA